MDANLILQKYFNFNNFLPGQQEVVEAISRGSDVVALMPTGGGKSLCYQLPALMSNKLTIVISPLIALMKDQVDSLNIRGINATFINSSLDYPTSLSRLNDLRTGRSNILYIAPERLSNVNFINQLKNCPVGIVAIDEAHCVSQWGHDFRPDYLLIKNYIKNFSVRPAVAAFTATATEEVKEDIIRNLALRSPQIFIRGFDRPNLKFFARADLDRKQRRYEVLRLTKSLTGSGIVYAITRRETEELADFLTSNGIRAVSYHAGMESGKRTQVQNDFMENRYKVIVATIAFGMGINKADVRFVIHAGMPASLENYYQEAGRAGRDGETAYCILLASAGDFGLHYHFIQKSREEMLRQGKNSGEVSYISNIKYQRLEKIRDYCRENFCRRRTILEYFSDPEASRYDYGCGNCDVCLRYQWQPVDVIKIKKERLVVEKPSSGRTSTVSLTVDLYQKNYGVAQIAKIRSLGETTIWEHLVRWHNETGGLDLRRFIAKEEQDQILRAIEKIGSAEKLKPLKEALPESVSYEHIKLVVADYRYRKK